MSSSPQRPFNMAATALEKYLKLIQIASFLAIKLRSSMLSESRLVSVHFLDL